MKIGRLAASAAIGAALMLLVKPALLRTDDGARLLVFLRWQSGEITFVNSVTDRPVTIRFRVGGCFKGFSVITDEVTEAYYTHGLYDINRAAGGDSIQTLGFCSMKGISIAIGCYSMFVKEGCMEVSLLWTI